MSRNTLSKIAICCLLIILLCMFYAGMYATGWLLFGGVVQAYEAESWLTVGFLQGAARIAASGPVILILIGLFFSGLKLVDYVGEWAKGRV